MKIRIQQPEQYVAKITELGVLSSLNFNTLMVLNLSNLRLNQFPTMIQTNLLQTLILDYNYLISFDEIDKFHNLQYLSIQNNQLQSIKIPGSLNYLNIKYNNIQEINIRQLEYLDIKHNPLKSFIIKPSQQIKSIHLGWLNVLSYLPKFQKGFVEENFQDIATQWESMTIKTLLGKITYKEFLIKAVNLIQEFGDNDQKETEFSDRLIIDEQQLTKYIKSNQLITCIKNNDYNQFQLILPILKNNMYTQQEETPLCMSIRNGKMKFVLLLMDVMQMDKEIDAFHQSIKQGQVGIVRKFIEFGMDCNAKNSKGHTPLTTAVLNITQNNEDQIIQLLLLNGAKPNNYNRNGLTAFQMCIVKSNLTALRFILNHNIKRCSNQIFMMNKKSLDGQYPLDLSIKSVSVFKFLIENEIGNIFSSNHQNLSLRQIAVICCEENLIILKLIRREQLIKVRMHFYSNNLKLFIQENSNLKIPEISYDYEESSCPDISDEEEEDLRKPKINKILFSIGEMSEQMKFVIYEQSEDENDNESSSQFDQCKAQYPTKLLYQQQDLLQLNIKNTSLNEWSKIKKISQMICYFKKHQMTLQEIKESFNSDYNDSSYYERYQVICKLRIEKQLYQQILPYQAILDCQQVFESVQVLGMEEYVERVKERIYELECIKIDEVMKQYIYLQYF